MQFVPEDRLEQLGAGGLVALTEAQVGKRLADLAADPAAWTPQHEGGQFSLAGAQAKIALRRQDGHWFEPWGIEATSHILKPAMPGLECQQLNEHLCLRIARRVGLPAAESELASIAGHPLVVVTRYDRLPADDRLLRLHQEDLCQALAVPPAAKYQSDGGPGPQQIVELLRRVLVATAAAQSVGTFIDALALSWVMAATDAHAKNYGLLLSGAQVRLAPLYDVNSVLPYLSDARRNVPAGQVSMHTARLAMTIGGKARLAEVDGRAWRELATVVRLDPNRLLERVGDLVQAAAIAATEVAEQECATGMLTAAEQDFAVRLAQAVQARAELCRTALIGRGPQRHWTG